MRTDISITRVRLVLVGMALVFATVAGFLIGVFSELKWRDKPDGSHPNATRTRGILPLNVTRLADFFQSSSSKASMFLKANDSREQTMGQVQWEEVQHSQGAALEGGGRWIRVDEAGLYLLFVQAVYKLNPAAVPAGVRAGAVTLEFQVLLEYREQDVVQMSSVFDTHCWGLKETDVTLSQAVLLQVAAGDRIAVNASHRHLMDYHAKPLSSFLTLLKYSNTDH
ncbi:uncharacterized protein si:dkey-220k22.3 isoform X1 [Anguilla rostrata]|uniref:uncharacterized protein si:dkey-220k22.3 isoform X1 n=2 Tax=Anguilla anguilla TaxID=7936 RepID=UPI0015A81EFC|nr:uncharacterized protein si:dkey-220k22.3 isoform X1 [Anguilla anguilla]